MSDEPSISYDYFDKIPAILFTSKSSSLDKTIDYIKEKINKKELTKYELPDAIICLDKGVIFYCPHLDSLKIKGKLKKKGIDFSNSGFLIYESKDNSDNLINFLRILLNFNSPTIMVSEFILNPYLNKIKTNAKFKFRPLKSTQPNK